MVSKVIGEKMKVSVKSPNFARGFRKWVWLKNLSVTFLSGLALIVLLQNFVTFHGNWSRKL